MSVQKPIQDLVDKVPTFDQYKTNTKAAVSYIFMVVFLCYFIYKEFIADDNCSHRIQTLETVIKQKDDMIEKLDKRVASLEVALDVRNGVIKQIEHKADSLISRVGGQK